MVHLNADLFIHHNYKYIKCIHHMIIIIYIRRRWDYHLDDWDYSTIYFEVTTAIENKRMIEQYNNLELYGMYDNYRAITGAYTT